MSDIIFPTSYVVFPASEIVLAVFEKRRAIMVLRHLQGRMAYAPANGGKGKLMDGCFIAVSQRISVTLHQESPYPGHNEAQIQS